MEFNLLEKLAVLKAIDEVIQMDQEIKLGEVKFMDRLSEAMDFDPALVLEARRAEPAEAIAVLKAMPEPQKQTLARLMNEAANADGEVDEREIQFIYRVFNAAGIDLKI
ncbi:Tellurite resistance protein TerB [Robiginitalea myxolifaciens]|uniref:Tellurite resistance protein TerB n=1 Tax=Robiginitalea myxolifaciens TaxID=400055 RepID=A0A1I6FW27_9FLAO|nr:TerB family tellurite resistance protein [Robiginitalea myxolifaciens]SFR34108.1 Tellurite resistance protein TerB [Robiginitalea myxolifaciens]